MAVESVSKPLITGSVIGESNVYPGMSRVPWRKKSYVHPEQTPIVLPLSASTDVMSLPSGTAIDDGVK